MRLPGLAWLDSVGRPRTAGPRFRQRALFLPRGLAGHLYWRAINRSTASCSAACNATSRKPPNGTPERDTGSSFGVSPLAIGGRYPAEIAAPGVAH